MNEYYVSTTLKIMYEKHPLPWKLDYDPFSGFCVVDAKGDYVFITGIADVSMNDDTEKFLQMIVERNNHFHNKPIYTEKEWANT